MVTASRPTEGPERRFELTRGYSLLAVGRQYHLPEGFDSGSQVSLIVSFLMFQS